MNLKTLLFLLFVTAALTTTVKGQLVPNAGFENWHNVGGWFDNPDDWTTNNTQLLGDFVERDSMPYQGDWGMKIKPHDTVPGLAYITFPLIAHPVSVQVFVKSQVTSGDTNLINVIVYSNDSVRDVGNWINVNAIPNWIPVNIPITQSTPEIDSLEIIIRSGRGQSWLSVDEFSLDLFTDVEEIADRVPAWSLAPNPMKEYTFLTFHEPVMNDYSFSLHNSSGQSLRGRSGVNDTRLRIDRKSLSPGLYFILLTRENEVLGTKQLIVE